MTLCSSAEPKEPASRSGLALLSRVHEGDPAALSALLDRHIDWLRAVVQRELRGDAAHIDEAGDILGEVVCRVLTARTRFEVEDEAAFRRVLQRIVRNTLIDRVRYHGAERRDHRREARLSSTVLRVDRPKSLPRGPDSIVAQNEMKAIVELALEKLEPEQREVLVLRGQHGWSFERIAQHFGGLSANGAGKKYHRARIAHGRAVRAIREARGVGPQP